MPWPLLFALSETATQVLGAVATGLLAAGATLFISRRVNSGSVDSSTAADLWTESKAIRQELGARLATVEGDNAKLRADNAALHADLATVKAENIGLKYEVRDLTTEVQRLREIVSD